MPSHEYKVVPAPVRPEKARGGKSTAEKFALSLTSFMNEYGRDGWEYVRAETLPCESKGWLGRKETSFQTMLVFRREVGDGAVGAAAPVAAEKVVRRLFSRDGAQEVIRNTVRGPAPDHKPAPQVVPTTLTSAASEGSAPRIFSPLPSDRPAQD